MEFCWIYYTSEYCILCNTNTNSLKGYKRCINYYLSIFIFLISQLKPLISDREVKYGNKRRNVSKLELIRENILGFIQARSRQVFLVNQMRTAKLIQQRILSR